MPRSRRTRACCLLSCLLVAKLVFLSGCGETDSAGGVAKTAEESRFNNLRKLGESSSKAAIADNKKKAMEESKHSPR